MNLKHIAKLNAVGFGKSDHYSEAVHIQEWIDTGQGWNGIIIPRVKGNIAGFAMWAFYDGAIHVERRAVYKKYRGLGLGTKLTKKVMALGIKYGYHYDTYCANWNIASINGNIKCGCLITKIGEQFTELSTKRREK